MQRGWIVSVGHFQRQLSLFPNAFLLTSEQGDEGHQPVLLHHLAEFVAQVVVCVGFQGVFEQDPARHQQVVQPVGDVEDDSGCRQGMGGGVSIYMYGIWRRDNDGGDSSGGKQTSLDGSQKNYRKGARGHELPHWFHKQKYARSLKNLFYKFILQPHVQ